MRCLRRRFSDEIRVEKRFNVQYILGGCWKQQSEEIFSLLFTTNSLYPRNIITFLLHYYIFKIRNFFCLHSKLLGTTLQLLKCFSNWIGHILRRNCLLYYAIDGQMAEVKGVGRRRTQLPDFLSNRRRYWELKEEAEDR